MATTTINTEFLENQIKQNITKNSATVSPLSILGATPISYGVTNLVSHSISGSSTVFEGEEKPVTPVDKQNVTVQRQKQVIILKRTKEAVRRDVDGVMNSLAAQAISQIVADVDLVIMNGTDRLTGDPIARIADSVIAPNATQLEATGDDLIADGDLFTALRTTGMSSPGLVLTNDSFNDISFAQNNGMRLYPEANADSSFRFFNSNSILVPSFGYDSQGVSGPTNANSNLALAGNFGNVYRNISSISVEASGEATLDGESMFQTNQIGVIFEVEYTFAVVNPSEFVLLKEAAA